ncbi:ABC transporter ATP-binding protein [Pseudorhodoferax sp.]|uniref:ABC transporter ATP-binding protein n=1 Tax=Pseudorhodoferax sp. TaxID=1993553 RepID=UPI002DD65535|nr:ABC transporter ATP-binding protein [Pseudorhodoferax sp.]
MKEILSVRDMHSGYGSIEVLRGINFSVHEGEILAVVGSNGAGKTTLLRTISGLIPASQGSIAFRGEDISRCSPAQIVARGVSQAPEGRRVFSGMSVEENLRLGAYRRPDKHPDVVDRALEQVYTYFPRLRERRRQLAGTMSGGEQQMCAIGRALMADPHLLIVDELSLGLAPLVVQELLDILAAVHERGCTIVLVEQDVSVALNFSDRAVVMKSGSVVLTGDASSLMGDDEVVRSYLGGE